MKISKYTFLFDANNTAYYIYSTLSNALVEIDEESYLYLLKAKNGKLDVFPSDIGDELYEVLIINKFITKNDIDSFLLYKSILTQQRTNQSHMHLTIAPTMDCCFCCHYCFEEHKDKNYMTEEVMDSIIEYINSLPSKPELKLTWFGGEPLMATSQMKLFYEKLTTYYKKPIASNIITTGFHIDEDVINVMKEIEISQVQITLDGLKATHNTIKTISNCDDVFSKVLDNIELLLSTSDIHVVFRINLTTQNAHEYTELFNYLMDKYKKHKRKGISPGFVMDRGACLSSNKNLFFTPQKASRFILDLYNKHQIHTPFLRYPSRFFSECAIKNVMSMSFDPDGYAYKCWEIIGNRKQAIGRLNVNGKIDNINQTIYNRHLYGADPLEDPVCSKCKYLPVCNGGCPIQRIENVFYGGKNNYCTLYKGKMEEFLKIHLKLKKKGITNQRN